jgi:FAD synthetase
MVFGTFDILHKGHLDFFRQALKLAKNPYLIVSVARDVNVKKIKGHPPEADESERVWGVRKMLGEVNIKAKVVMGAKTHYIGHILKIRPDIIALGYDQKAYTKGLAKALKERGLNVKVRRMKAFQPNKYKTSLYKRKML